MNDNMNYGNERSDQAHADAEAKKAAGQAKAAEGQARGGEEEEETTPVEPTPEG